MGVATGVRLAVHVTASARKNEVIGVLGNELKIRLQAPPVEGKANAALIRYLGNCIGVPKSQVHVIRGRASRHKVIAIDCAALTLDEVRRTLQPVEAK